MNDEEIIQKAKEFAKQNRENIAKVLTDLQSYPPDAVQTSVFMAGSPGAGKTEYSKILINVLEKNKEHKIIRIDADELRAQLPGYTGNNSRLFHGAVSLIVERIQDFALRQNQTFIMDGTMAKFEKAAENIKRSLSKGRQVFIFYLYQKPEIAWKFTVAREEAEGRNIPKEVFIQQFLSVQDSIKRVRKEFGREVVIFLVKKDFLTNTAELIKIEPNGKEIDDLLNSRYTKEDLESLL